MEITSDQVEWIGNEVSCGVGMQRIDVMLSKVVSDNERVIMPIELKAVPANADNTRQISRYIDWIEQYYIPNRISIIQPILICRKGALDNNVINTFKDFNSKANGRYLPLKFIQHSVQNGQLIFTNISY